MVGVTFLAVIPVKVAAAVADNEEGTTGACTWRGAEIEIPPAVTDEVAEGAEGVTPGEASRSKCH